jgi:predicted transcriptional regulator
MDIEQTVALCKALADRSRLLILRALHEQPQYLEELAQRVNLAVSTVSFHLKKMEATDLVYKRKEQYYTIFYPRQNTLTLTLQELLQFTYEEEQMQQQRIRDYKEKVLKAFYREGRIHQIPAQKQKRWIVFEPILNEFAFGRSYTEAEVNEIIKRFNEDYCLIRRTFIEERVMSRENNEYRITENYENFRNGVHSESIKHGLKESYEQAIRDKFGVTE